MGLEDLSNSCLILRSRNRDEPHWNWSVPNTQSSRASEWFPHTQSNRAQDSAQNSDDADPDSDNHSPVNEDEDDGDGDGEDMDVGEDVYEGEDIHDEEDEYSGEDEDSEDQDDDDEEDSYYSTGSEDFFFEFTESDNEYRKCNEYVVKFWCSRTHLNIQTTELPTSTSDSAEAMALPSRQNLYSFDPASGQLAFLDSKTANSIFGFFCLLNSAVLCTRFCFLHQSSTVWVFGHTEIKIHRL